MRLNKKETRQSLASPRESGKTNRYVQKKVSKLRFQKEFSPGRKKKRVLHMATKGKGVLLVGMPLEVLLKHMYLTKVRLILGRYKKTLRKQFAEKVFKI